MQRGRFITLEGGEGAGKSTQIKRLMARLETRGIRVLSTREPGGSPKAERIREVILSGAAKDLGPMAEALLFSAARADHLDKTIRPALARGTWVLCDRFTDSTRAYQGALGNLDPALIRALERIVVGETTPDLTLILDLAPEDGLARAAARGQALGEGADRFEAEDIDFHRTLRQAFLDIAEAEPERCVVIPADADADTVERRIWQAVDDRLVLADAPREAV